MKSAAFILLFVSTTAVLADSALLGPDQPIPGKGSPRMDTVPQVCLDMLTVSLPEDKALPLLPALRDASTISAAQARLLELIARKEATFIGWPQVTTLSGNRSGADSIASHVFATGYERPGSPFDFVYVPGGPLSKNPERPTSFMDRGTGFTFECEPKVAEDGRAVGVQLFATLLRPSRYNQFTYGIGMTGGKFTIMQPTFETHAISTSFRLRDGERKLVYVGKPIEPGSPFTLLIVGVKIIPAGPAK